jgi:hypothetical protein
MIGFLLIALMGSDDWRTREFATNCFDTACYYDLLPYEVEKAAFKHKDLEIQHRANRVLSNYYYCDNGKTDMKNRKFYIHGTETSIAFELFRERKEKAGWKLITYWHDGTGKTCMEFRRVE